MKKISSIIAVVALLCVLLVFPVVTFAASPVSVPSNYFAVGYIPDTGNAPTNYSTQYKACIAPIGYSISNLFELVASHQAAPSDLSIMGGRASYIGVFNYDSACLDIYRFVTYMGINNTSYSFDVTTSGDSHYPQITITPSANGSIHRVRIAGTTLPTSTSNFTYTTNLTSITFDYRGLFEVSDNRPLNGLTASYNIWVPRPTDAYVYGQKMYSSDMGWWQTLLDYNDIPYFYVSYTLPTSPTSVNGSSYFSFSQQAMRDYFVGGFIHCNESALQLRDFMMVGNRITASFYVIDWPVLSDGSSLHIYAGNQLLGVDNFGNMMWNNIQLGAYTPNGAGSISDLPDVIDSLIGVVDEARNFLYTFNAFFPPFLYGVIVAPLTIAAIGGAVVLVKRLLGG